MNFSKGSLCIGYVDSALMAIFITVWVVGVVLAFVFALMAILENE